MVHNEKKFFWALIVGLGIGLGSDPAQGQNIQMGEMVNEITVRPGGQGNVSLFVTNSGDESFSCDMRATNMGVSPEGRPYSTASDDPHGCANWIEFKPEKFTLKGRSKMEIKCRLRVPRGVVGGYYALLTCFINPPEQKVDQGVELPIGLYFSSSLLVNVFSQYSRAEITTRTPQIQEGGIDTTTAIRGNQGWTAIVPFVNTGNIHDKIKGKVTILNENAQVIERVELSAGYGFIFPNQTREFKAVGHKQIPDGIYALKAEVYTEKSRKYGEISAQFAVLNRQIVQHELTPEMAAVITSTRLPFTLEPMEINVRIPPKAKNTRAIQITNVSEDTLILTVESQSWGQDSLGNVILYEKTPVVEPSQQLLVVEPQQCAISPKRRATFKVIFQMPAEATGEYYSALTFTPINRKLSEDMIYRLNRSVLLRAAAKGTEMPKLEIDYFTQHYLPKQGSEFKFALKNLGNVSCYPQITILLSDDKGNNVGDPIRITKAPEMILSGQKIVYSHLWSRILPPGKYTAILSCIYTNDRIPLNKSIQFTSK